MISVKVDQLILSNMGFAVLLKGKQDKRSLPIIIGAAEAQAIALRLNKVTVPRPLTHDLLKNVLDYIECRLMKIEVNNLQDGTFYAKLILERDGRKLEMDSRPSDAIALALRCDAPIYVDEEVMNEAGRVFEEAADAMPGNEMAEQAQSGKKKEMTPLEALSHDLEIAVQEERYEDAAKLRDEIERMKSAHGKN